MRDYETLYNRYIKPLEKANSGEFAAVSLDGEVILSKRDVEAVKKGLSKFGRGKFILVKIGAKSIGKWRAGYAK